MFDHGFILLSKNLAADVRIKDAQNIITFSLFNIDWIYSYHYTTKKQDNQLPLILSAATLVGLFEVALLTSTYWFL